jgi:predicted nucleic acid-binding protein
VTFLDTSVIIDMLDPSVDGVEAAAEHHGRPFLTSSICVFEVLNGVLGSGSTDVVAERNRFGGVRALEFNDRLALEAARLQDELVSDGDRLAARDAIIAATARSTGDHLLVADTDFRTSLLESRMDVTNLTD